MATIKSTEEKAKAYDEVVNKLKGFMTQGVDPLITRADAQDFFPELKESEDERIRGNIIATIHLYYGEPLEDEAKEMIAWLEKQSTPQVRTGLEWVNTIDDACDKRYAEEYAHGEYCHEQSFKWGFQEGVAWLEKQREQKPAEWNTNDEQMLNSTIKDLIHPCYEEIPDRIEEEIKWIKSMRNRVLPQPNQEWSEEDEKMLEELLNYCDTSIQYNGIKSLQAIKWKKRKDWLKSLRPQNTWRPSDEQMKALNYVVNLMASSESPKENDYYYNVFKDLKEQLKQL